MRFTGILKTWHDERGFGFIEPTQGGQELFVHIKEFPPGTGRPSAGQQLSFEVETTAQGKKRARAVHYPVYSPAQSPIQASARAAGMRRATHAEEPAGWSLPRRLAIPLFLVLYAAVVWRWGWVPIVAIGYLGLSLLTFLAYALDKSAAVAGRWRIAERTLHLLGLAGGWPGALLAQQMLRHKTSKPGFLAVFWITVLLNVGAFIAWHAGWLTNEMTAGWLRGWGGHAG